MDQTDTFKALPLPLHTSRLLIRKPQPSDLQDVYEAMQDSKPELQRWMSWAKEWPDQEELKDFYNQSADVWENGGRHYRFECFSRENDRFTTSLGVSIDDWEKGNRLFHISYWARSTETGQGYTTEAVKALMGMLFNEAGAKRIITGHDKGNIASQRVIEKCGFKPDPHGSDEISYELTSKQNPGI